MTKQFNTIVVGLGAMGSATLYQLAKRGVSALGIDRFSPPHPFGSTHGDTRITRKAIGEGPHYTPLSLRSYEIFSEVEKATNRKILEITGGLIICSPGSTSFTHGPGFFEKTLAAAKEYGIRHEILDAQEIRKQFPQFSVQDDEIAYFEHEAAFLHPEVAVQSQLDLARERGAIVHTHECMEHFEETDTGMIVRTDQDIYGAERLVLSVGPWLPQVTTQFGSIFKVYRQVLYWFDVSNAFNDFVPGKFPVFVWKIKGHENEIYGFPAIDGSSGGFKIASEDFIDPVTPESVNRSVTEEEVETMFKNKVAPYFPQVGKDCVKSAVCLYTVTADSAFVIDCLPSSKRIVLCSPCSGHGFKHSAAIGECIAEMVTTGKSKIDISAFALERLLSIKQIEQFPGPTEFQSWTG